jgi:Ca2+/H+ antiporter
VQAQQSFQLSRAGAFAGLLLLIVGIALGVYFNIHGHSSLNAAYLAAASGALTEFISGVLLVLYGRTLQQVNRFHDRLVASQQVSLAFLASDLVTNESSRNESKLELAKTLMGKAFSGREDGMRENEPSPRRTKKTKDQARSV